VFVTKQPEEGNVFAGMTADVSLVERTLRDDIFMVPVSAVFGDETGAKSVWVLDESTMRPEKRDVELGEMSGESVIVANGLNPGETIIIAGAHAVREGKEVRPVTDELRERR
jgi:multidrug efflux pump subunit AcrA (membrane-fusion protein)